MKILVKLIKFVILTILASCIIILGVSQIFENTILSKKYVMKKLEETSFYSETYELVKSNFEKYIYQSGLDEDVLIDICSQEKVIKDINVMVSNIYDGTKQDIDSQEIKNKLNTNIDKLEIKNSQNKKAIEQFIEQICKEYEATLNHTKYENVINNIYVKLMNVLENGLKIISVSIILLVILIIVINRKNFMKNIQDLGIVIFASGIFEIIACFIINLRINIKGIKIFNENFSNIIVNVIQDIIQKISTLGIIISIISVIIIISYGIITNFIQKKEKK